MAELPASSEILVKGNFPERHHDGHAAKKPKFLKQVGSAGRKFLS